MFEDLKPQNNPPMQSNQSAEGAAMPAKAAISSQQSEVKDAEDMLSGVAEIKPMSDKTNVNRPFLKGAAKNINDVDPDELKRESNRKRFIFIGISASAIIFIIAFFIIVNAWDFFSIKTDVKEPEKNTAVEEKKENIKAEDGKAEDKKNEETAAKPQTEIKDADNDGLSDEEEGKLGTSINNVDTDDDGLSDREEIKVYKTDPLNPDTDGDTYKDGVEVKGGYNPKGEGKLLENF